MVNSSKSDNEAVEDVLDVDDDIKPIGGARGNERHCHFV